MSVQGLKRRHGRRIRRVAFYDVDGTLTDLNLLHATAFVVANLGEWAGRAGYLIKLAANLPLLYLAERDDRRLLNVAMFSVLKGVSRDRLFSLGEEYCDRVLMRHLYPQAVELLHANRAAGLEPILVTGSPDFVAQPLAERLGIKTIAANRFVFTRGCATGRLHEPIIAGSEKAQWCVEYAAANGLDLADCWGYADSIYDLQFLSALGHPVAVNPDRKLARTAASRQWPIVRFAGIGGSLVGQLAELGLGSRQAPEGVANGAS
jgi:HAD superfamily hydrolase (TIGR01490 family)